MEKHNIVILTMLTQLQDENAVFLGGSRNMVNSKLVNEETYVKN
jgi:hypothetical protein